MKFRGEAAGGPNPNLAKANGGGEGGCLIFVGEPVREHSGNEDVHFFLCLVHEFLILRMQYLQCSHHESNLTRFFKM
jgi:hypothetical protein